MAKLLGYAFVVNTKRELKTKWQMHFQGGLITFLSQVSKMSLLRLVVCCFFQFLILLGCISSEIATLKTNLCSNLFNPFKLVLLPFGSLGKII